MLPNESERVVDRGPNAVSSPALPARIVKRDGRDAPFDPARIASALVRAGAATGEFDADEAQLLTARVLKVLRHRHGGSAPSVEQVQDVVGVISENGK